MARKGLLERVNAVARRVETKTFTQPPFWALDTAQYPWSNAATPTQERIENDFLGYVNGAYKGDGIVFSTINRRQQVFSQGRFQWQKYTNGLPGKPFGTGELALLENPWTNGTTGELLAYLEVMASLAGNAYLTTVSKDGSIGNASRGKPGRWISRLRPDWMTLVIDAVSGDPWGIDAYVAGFLYQPRVYGSTPGEQPGTLLLPDEVCHYSPLPDPAARFRGMSWLTPTIKDVQGDIAATDHKLGFFRRGATPSLVVKGIPATSPEQFDKLVTMMEAKHAGVDNAYRCLHPDTEVAMWDGSRYSAYEVRRGDVVVAWLNGEAVPGRVTAAQWQPPSPIVTVTTQRGRVIKTNDRHPFLTRRVIRQGCKHLSDEMWVAASALRYGDLLTTGLGWATNDAPDSITAYEAWVLGLIVGDGTTVSSTPVISAWNENVRTRLQIGHQLNWTGKGHDYRVLGVRALCVTAGIMGKRSYEKRIPLAVMTGSIKVKAAFLSGLIDADGHVTNPTTRRSAEVGITSTCYELLRDAQHILASLGINASLSLAMPAGAAGGGAHGIGVRKRDAWRLSVFGNHQAFVLSELLDLACESKSSRLLTYADTSSRDNRSKVDRVVSVEIGPPAQTIGIEVGGYHTHVTGGVVTHNTLYLTAGADATALGADLKQLDFKVTQGGGEVRLAVAGGVPASILGISEGLSGSSLNAGNFGAARRLFVDTTIQNLWSIVAPSLQNLVDLPPGSSGVELTVDPRNIPFMREDATDDANIRFLASQTLNQLLMAGWDPDAAVRYVTTGDLSSLIGQHSGMSSVQLLPPASNGSANSSVNSSNETPSLNGSGTVRDPTALTESTNSN